jgi:hypothetical protein
MAVIAALFADPGTMHIALDQLETYGIYPRDIISSGDAHVSEVDTGDSPNPAAPEVNRPEINRSVQAQVGSVETSFTNRPQLQHDAFTILGSEANIFSSRVQEGAHALIIDSTEAEQASTILDEAGAEHIYRSDVQA